MYAFRIIFVVVRVLVNIFHIYICIYTILTLRGDYNGVHACALNAYTHELTTLTVQLSVIVGLHFTFTATVE